MVQVVGHGEAGNDSDNDNRGGRGELWRNEKGADKNRGEKKPERAIFMMQA